MRNYYRILLGSKNVFFAECLQGGFIGADYGIKEDLTGRLPSAWREFNESFIPIFLDTHPNKSKIGAGLACGMLWTVAKGMESGDRVLCPDGTGMFHVGEIAGDYRFAPSEILPHRRPVTWLPNPLHVEQMSEGLASSVLSRGTVCNLSRSGHGEELDRLIGSIGTDVGKAAADGVEDPTVFAMEQHLEDFLVRNWSQTELGQEFDIYEEDGEPVGQQYPTDSGPLDILAVSKDKKRLLVVELKRGRASDKVVGQILRYMGFVKDELAESGQEVVGAIIALEDDLRIRRALSMTPGISFYRYKINFQLIRE